MPITDNYYFKELQRIEQGGTCPMWRDSFGCYHSVNWMTMDHIQHSIRCLKRKFPMPEPLGVCPTRSQCGAYYIALGKLQIAEGWLKIFNQELAHRRTTPVIPNDEFDPFADD